ncbi:methyltransferase domain-containing protein [Methylophaga sp.]|uniref:class I SAM-dependent methyltransferase n=1 Tax=Methylophaga sp. TaxID=2024840 RepID=UPI003F6A2DAE
MQTSQTEKTLEFSHKYDHQHALAYFKKHADGFWRRLSNWREQAVARKALKIAGKPSSVLDLPCGTGRFWGTLSEQSNREIHACDYSEEMLQTGLNYRPEEWVQRIQAFQGSAFSIPVEDNFVENLFCVRLLHHIGDSQDRISILKEFHRVASDSVIVSLWIGGNYKAWKRGRLEAKRTRRDYQNRFVISADTIEAEFSQAGFQIKDHIDFLPGLSMWRFYVLEKVSG